MFFATTTFKFWQREKHELFRKREKNDPAIQIT